MEDVQRITGLEDQHVSDVYDLFAHRARVHGDGGLLTLGAFSSAFLLFPGCSPSHPLLPLVVGGLFAALDADGSGCLSPAELATGLSVLCGGPSEDKVQAAFDLFDQNGDGTISRPEMETYLRAMFAVIFFVNPEAEAEVGPGVTPLELAKATASQAFIDNDRNGDGVLSREEFNAWYMTGGVMQMQMQTQMQTVREATSSASASALALAPVDLQPAWLTLSSLRAVTTFGSYAAGDVFDVFAGACDGRGTLGRDDFEASARLFVGEEAGRDARATVVEGMFRTFGQKRAPWHRAELEQQQQQQQQEEEEVDFAELMSGISVLCAGTRDERALAAFKLFDVEDCGYITKSELAIYLTNVFKLLFWVQPFALAGQTPAELGAITAQEAFDDAMANESGCDGENLTFEEFKRWNDSFGGGGVGEEEEEEEAEGGEYEDGSDDDDSETNEGGEEDELDGESTARVIQQKLREVRHPPPRRPDICFYFLLFIYQRTHLLTHTMAQLAKLTSLHLYTAPEMLSHLASIASSEDCLIGLTDVYHLLLHLNQERGAQALFDSDGVAQFVVSLKTTFDSQLPDGANESLGMEVDLSDEINARLDLQQIAAGLLVLCRKSSWGEKVAVGFSIFENDGQIDYDDIIVFLESVFKVISLAAPDLLSESDEFR